MEEFLLDGLLLGGGLGGFVEEPVEVLVLEEGEFLEGDDDVAFAELEGKLKICGVRRGRCTGLMGGLVGYVRFQPSPLGS